jgi:hypothetical protein
VIRRFVREERRFLIGGFLGGALVALNLRIDVAATLVNIWRWAT